MKLTTEYYEQAEQFLKETKTKFTAKYLETGRYFDGDTADRDIYRVTLTRNGKRYSFKFGDSIVHLGRGFVYAYDILSCLTKNDPGTFEDFYADYGYDEDSRKAEKVYKAVVKEWLGVNRLFSDVLEQLSEIQ